MKNILLLLFLLSSNICASAVGSGIRLELKGSVYSVMDSLPLSGAVIEVLLPDSNRIMSLVSDKSGVFVINHPVKNDVEPFYLLRTSYVGFVDSYTMVKGDFSKPIDVGRIYMNDNNILTEVVIQGDRRIYQAGKTIVVPSKIEVKSSTNSIDLLGNLNLPGLMTNAIEQRATINGQGVVYQINGRPQSREQFLAINPEEIQKIEYSDFASSRYMNQNVGGVINVILKERVTGGSAFANAITSPVAGFLNATARASYHIRKSEFSLLYDNSWRDYDKRKVNQSEMLIHDPDTICRMNKGMNAPFGYISQTIDLGYTYVPDEKTMLSILISNGIGRQHDENKWDMYETASRGNEQRYYRNSNYKFNSYSPSVDVYYVRKMKNNRAIEANIVGTFLNSYYTRRLTDDDVITTQNRVDNRRRSVIAEVLHKKGFKNLSWDLGVNHTISYTKNVYSNSVTKMDANDTYLYTQIAGKVKSLSYDIGTGFKLYSVDNRTNNKTYLKNLTTVNLLYPIGRSLRVSYRFQLKPTLPSLSQLSDVFQQYDVLTGIKGNPELKPFNSTVNRILLTYFKKKFRANFWLSYYLANKPVAQTVYYDDQTGMYISEYRNQKKNDKVNSQIDLSLNSILNHINFSVSGGWQRFGSEGADYKHTLNNMYWSANLSFYYKEFSLSANYVRPQKSLSSELVMLAENNSSVMLMYKKNNLSLNLGVFYPFTKDWVSSSWSLSKVNPSSKRVTIRDNSNMLVVGLSYYLNYGKNFNKNKKGLSNSDNVTGILKVE